MPGIPPNTVDNVKRLLKGIFRRGKNKKQNNATEQTSASQPVASAPAQSPAANGTTPAVDKPLPPTHPLATGEHDSPQGALPQDHSTQLKPAPGAEDAVKAEGQSAPSATPTPATHEERPPAPPPKNDVALDAPKLDTSEDKENAPASANIPPSDSAIATPNTPAKTTETIDDTKPELPSNAPAVEMQTTKAVGEKEALHSDPAVPKTSATANGMSATSGPLEDFPAGMAGDKE